jgi:hypothetical protein
MTKEIPPFDGTTNEDEWREESQEESGVEYKYQSAMPSIKFLASGV